MSLHGIYLKEFGQAVSTCTGQEPLEVVLGWLLQGDRDRLVVVNAHHHPMGEVRLHDLLPFVLPVNAADLEAAQPCICWHQPIQDFMPSVISPLVVLPADWTVAQGLPLMAAAKNQSIALVNADVQFVGLLQCDRILQALAHSLKPSNENPNPSPAALNVTSSLADNLLQSQQQQIHHLTQQLLVQRAELEQRIKSQQQEIMRLNGLRLVDAPVHQDPVFAFQGNATQFTLTEGAQIPLFDILLKLLDRLPVPLMLQTSEGIVLAQNLLWCQQMGDLADPVKIWREAAVWLGNQVSVPPTPTPGNEPWAGYAPIDLALASPAIAPLPLPQNDSPPAASPCQLGADPDHCVCVCPLKDGHERVVQFVKISLKTLLPELAVHWLANTASAQVATMTAPTTAVNAADLFHLATLTPDTPLDGVGMKEHLNLTQQTTASSATAIADPSLQTLWIVMAQDVTQQQHLARELTAKNADLVQLNRLKDEFLACISHELKTPLTAVLGLSSLLKDQTLGDLNPRQVHYAQLIYQSSRHLMGVVNDILDLTRIETGQLELLYGTVDIAIVCSRSLEQAKQMRVIEGRNATETGEFSEQLITLQIEPHLQTLIADEMRLRQMLVHLLSNALKFTAGQNAIGLRVSQWGGWIAFTVWDDGIGIAADKQHLIFQKFQQLENPLTRQFEGAGLGLVLTRRLARLHGGDVTFISKEGAGSQFTILLPPTPPDKTQLTRNSMLQDEEEIAASAMRYPSGRVPVFSHRTTPSVHDAIALTSGQPDRLVLIVDAVVQYVEALTDKLISLGYRVVIARSGTEALEKARRLQPAVIFLNPLLPLLSGWDVLTLLKSGTETQHLPVVVMATMIEQARAQQHQADGFLQLPVQSAKLQALLQRLILGPKEGSARSPSTPLTLLRLFNSSVPGGQPKPLLNLDELLRSQHYRILEADDLDQAALLAEVWSPHVVLLEGAIAAPMAYLQHLGQQRILASLPIVILDPDVAQVANQIPGLQIFPCLLQQEGSPPNLATLLQVIQVAAGCIWHPSILAVNLSTLTETAEPARDRAAAIGTHEITRFPKEAGWLQALVQYLQTAGLEGFIGHSWQEVMQQLTSQSVDLLLLCWTHGEPSPLVLRWLAQLQELTPRPPILVLDHRDPELGEPTLIPLPKQLRSLATDIISPPLSMSDLLEQIQRMINR